MVVTELAPCSRALQAELRPIHPAKGYPIKTLVAFSGNVTDDKTRGHDLHRRGDEWRHPGNASCPRRFAIARNTRCCWSRRSTRPVSINRCCTRCTWTSGWRVFRPCRRCRASTASTRSRKTPSSSTSSTTARRFCEAFKQLLRRRGNGRRGQARAALPAQKRA